MTFHFKHKYINTVNIYAPKFSLNDLLSFSPSVHTHTCTRRTILRSNGVGLVPGWVKLKSFMEMRNSSFFHHLYFSLTHQSYYSTN